MRRRNCKNAKVRLAQFDKIMVFNPGEYQGRWHEVFNNQNDLYVEIGMGKGQFIIQQALNNPHINYIGIEKYDSVILQAAKKTQDLGINNLRMLAYDANKLMDIFTEAQIAKIYLNFSDPWPKAAHAKRRLTSPLFLKMYRTLLTKTGTIEQKTDNLALFEYSLAMYQEAGFIEKSRSFDLHASTNAIITTEYEDRFRELGHPIYFVEVKNG